jgi:hypothetical protein
VKFSPTVHRIAVVLTVVFVLAAIWAAYSLYAGSRTSPSSSPPAVATYSQATLNSFVAAVAPSYLYNNSTEVTGGNTTLFTPITKWINASLSYSLECNRTAALSVNDTFSVTLSTAVWSKTLFTSSNQSSTQAGTVATTNIQYAINVSSVVSLVKEIDAQLDYQGTGYTLSLSPIITASVEVAGIHRTVQLDPEFTFSFQGSLIQPSGLSNYSTGSLIPVGNPVTPGDPALWLPALALIGSVGALVGSTWVATRWDNERQEPSLEQLIRPYEEAIAVIAQAPKGTPTASVATFADLVKIADTLGKPILRPAGPWEARRTFYVLDGGQAYAYQHPTVGRNPSLSEATVSSPPDTERPAERASLVQELQRQVQRLDRLSLDATTVADVRRRARRALDLIRVGRDREAAVEIRQLSRLSARGSSPQVERP